MSTTEGELDVEVSREREEGEVRTQLLLLALYNVTLRFCYKSSTITEAKSYVMLLQDYSLFHLIQYI